MDNDELEGVTHGIRECQLYTIPQVCKFFGYKSRSTVYRMLGEGSLKGFRKNGRVTRVLGRDIVAYFKSGGM